MFANKNAEIAKVKIAGLLPEAAAIFNVEGDWKKFVSGNRLACTVEAVQQEVFEVAYILAYGFQFANKASATRAKKNGFDSSLGARADYETKMQNALANIAKAGGLQAFCEQNLSLGDAQKRGIITDRSCLFN